jgi:hypothetical protein
MERLISKINGHIDLILVEMFFQKKFKNSNLQKFDPINLTKNYYYTEL